MSAQALEVDAKTVQVVVGQAEQPQLTTCAWQIISAAQARGVPNVAPKRSMSISASPTNPLVFRISFTP